MSTPALPSSAVFGAGGDEPWARAMQGLASGLALVREGRRNARREPLHVGRWMAAADGADRTSLRRLEGPVLDVGCGPGRMVGAARAAGLAATGIDVSPDAVDRCRRAGLPVLLRDVFAPLPDEGGWGAVLLIDGNIGIGGDPAALLARCRSLLRPDGALVVETHPNERRDSTSVVRVVGGGVSAPFPWAEVGERALTAHAAGFDVDAAWSAGGRRFVRLRRAADRQRDALRSGTRSGAH